MNDETRAYLTVPENKLKLWKQVEVLYARFKGKQPKRYHCCRDYILPELIRETPELSGLHPADDVEALTSIQMQGILMDRWVLVPDYVDLRILYKGVKAENKLKQISTSEKVVAPVAPVAPVKEVKARPSPLKEPSRENGNVSLPSNSNAWKPRTDPAYIAEFEALHKEAFKEYQKALRPLASKCGGMINVHYQLCQRLSRGNGWWKIVLKEEQSFTDE
jgi:hypothetical protein